MSVHLSNVRSMLNENEIDFGKVADYLKDLDLKWDDSEYQMIFDYLVSYVSKSKLNFFKLRLSSQTSGYRQTGSMSSEDDDESEYHSDYDDGIRAADYELTRFADDYVVRAMSFCKSSTWPAYPHYKKHLPIPVPKYMGNIGEFRCVDFSLVSDFVDHQTSLKTVYQDWGGGSKWEIPNRDQIMEKVANHFFEGDKEQAEHWRAIRFYGEPKYKNLLARNRVSKDLIDSLFEDTSKDRVPLSVIFGQEILALPFSFPVKLTAQMAQFLSKHCFFDATELVKYLENFNADNSKNGPHDYLGLPRVNFPIDEYCFAYNFCRGLMIGIVTFSMDCVDLFEFPDEEYFKDYASTLEKNILETKGKKKKKEAQQEAKETIQVHFSEMLEQQIVLSGSSDCDSGAHESRGLIVPNKAKFNLYLTEYYYTSGDTFGHSWGHLWVSPVAGNEAAAIAFRSEMDKMENSMRNGWDRDLQKIPPSNLKQALKHSFMRSIPWDDYFGGLDTTRETNLTKEDNISIVDDWLWEDSN